ncbi:MAG TPA: hypothetical protein VK071_02090 [Tissierellales bacterium]|nr:hypothetical protein [Tissierellales bacterium]
MDIQKYVSEGLIAFIPVYVDMKGNCTLLYTFHDKAYVDKNLRSVLNLLAKYFFLDLKESRKYLGGLLNIKNLVPIPFNKENIFIPVKIRKPYFKNDGATGYININSIDKLERQESKTLIYLKGNHKILCLNSLETANKHVKNGHIVKKLIESNRGYSCTIRENISFYNEYDKPATKGDIALLRKEITDIRSVFY